MDAGSWLGVGFALALLAGLSVVCVMAGAPFAVVLVWLALFLPGFWFSHRVFADVFFQTVGALAWSSVLLGVLAWVSAWNGVLPVALWFVVAVDALLFLVAWGLPIGKPFSLRAPSVRAQAVVGAFALLSFCLFLAFAGGSLDSVRPVFFGSTDSVLNVVQVDAMVGSGSLGLPLFLNASGEAAFSVWTPFVSLTAPAFSGALGGLNGFDSSM
jgi:hypothetical protein